MLTGEDKRLYQRKYMRMRRSKLKLSSRIVRPKTSSNVRPNVDADGSVIHDN